MSRKPLRAIFMGMLGAFSAIPLERLLAADAEVSAVVVPTPHDAADTPPMRVVDPPAPRAAPLHVEPRGRPNVVALAHAHGIPVLEVRDTRHAQTLSLLRALAPDVIVVACFPFILPQTLLTLPTQGAFNLHPSLLPKLRGPAPLFWVFHESCCAGITLHRMSARADAGDIVAQMPLEFPDGMRYAEAEHACAQWGARLLVDALRELARGTLQTTPQDERAASYFAQPTEKDFVITPEWSARRAFNFIRGIEGYAGPAVIHADGRAFVVREAIGYEMGAPMREPLRVEGTQLALRCADGVLHIRAR